MSLALFESTFDDVFWLTFSGAVFAFGGVCLQAILKSRCKEFHCCGLSCVRDIPPPGQEPDLEIARVPPITIPTRSTPPSPPRVRI